MWLSTPKKWRLSLLASFKIRKLDTESRAWSTQAYVSLEVGRHSFHLPIPSTEREREASSSHGKVGDGDVLESFRLDLSVLKLWSEWWVVLFGEDHTQFCRRPLCVRGQTIQGFLTEASIRRAVEEVP